MVPSDRDRLRHLLSSFDEAGLVALANKGLVRRAMKDLPAETLSIVETDSCLIVQGAGWQVTMPVAGPVAATDDTRASGITRQILMATMFLRDTWCVPETNLEQPDGLPCPAESDLQPAPVATVPAQE